MFCHREVLWSDSAAEQVSNRPHTSTDTSISHQIDATIATTISLIDQLSPAFMAITRAADAQQQT